MKIVRYPNFNNDEPKTIVLGSFETFHIGHFELLKKANEISGNTKITILLLENYGKINFESLNIRLQNFANLNIKYLILAQFDLKFKKTSPNEFINILRTNYNVKNIVVGKDFRYGHNASAGTKELVQEFENTFVCDILKVNNLKISSTIIKEQIEFGDLDFANSLLVNSWKTNAMIKANNFLKIESDFNLPPGVYAIKCEYKNFSYFAYAHIDFSTNKTRVYFIKDNFIEIGREITISWESKIRRIIKSSDNKISPIDLENVELFFRNNL